MLTKTHEQQIFYVFICNISTVANAECDCSYCLLLSWDLSLKKFSLSLFNAILIAILAICSLFFNFPEFPHNTFPWIVLFYVYLFFSILPCPFSKTWKYLMVVLWRFKAELRYFHNIFQWPWTSSGQEQNSKSGMHGKEIFSLRTRKTHFNAIFK